MFITSNFIIFRLVSIVLVISASMVIISNHAVFSLLFLVLCFIFSSFLLFLLECEFLALVFLVIYVGAIAVLFLFAVMMLNSKKVTLSRSSMKYLPAGLLIGLSFLTPMLYQVSAHFKSENKNLDLVNNLNINWYDLIDSATDIEVYGQVLYSYFVLQLLVAGLILLVVLIGVVYLTNTYNSKQNADQSTFKQLSVGSKFFY